MESALFNLLYLAGEYSTAGYLLLLAIAIVTERKLTSITVTLAVVALGACIASLALQPLYQIASHDHPLSKLSWYGTWMVLDVFSLWLLVHLHQTLGLRVSRMCLAAALALVGLTMLQAADFLDVITVKTDLIAPIYQLGVLSIHVGLIPVIIFYWWQEIHLRKAIRLGAI